MAIKITKPGQTVFRGFCDRCGCEFTYEIVDLALSALGNKVSCPTCGKDYLHPAMVQDPTIPGGLSYQWPTGIAPLAPDEHNTDPCAGCSWREHFLRDGIYVGDTPCTWCNKNKFNSTCDSTSPLNGTIQGNDISIKTYLNDYAISDSCSCTSKEVPGTYTTAYNGCCDDTEGYNSCSG